jgi:RNA polymerase sigma factor (sigma-70 family)
MSFVPVPHHALGRLSDERLVAHIRAAHGAAAPTAVADAFDVLHHRHRRRIGYLLSSKLPAERAEDLLQDVFLDAFEAIVGGREIDHLSGWLARVAHNTVADFWRGREGRQLKLDRSASPTDDADARRAEPSAEGDFGEWEVREVVEQLLAARKQTHREIVRRNVLEGRPARDVAEATGETEDNVYQVAKRFRDELRRLLRGDRLNDNDKDRN